MSSAMEIYKKTAKTNCKECGFETCMKFAIHVDNQKANINQCPYIKTDSLLDPSAVGTNTATKTSPAASTKTKFHGANSAGIVYGNVSNASTITSEHMFHTPKGHGYAAEHANHLHDKIKNLDFFGQEKVKLVGEERDPSSNRIIKHGADRIVNGTQIQTKYCSTGAKCIEACFQDGKLVYVNSDGTPMQIEVPADKEIYEAAVKAMEERIKRGEVPGVTDPAEAKNIVKRGVFKYLQAKNIAKAGTVESITFDAVNGAIVASSSFGISAALTFATSIWNGDSFDIALKSATYSGLKVGGTTFVTAVLAGQLTKAGLNSALVSSSEAIVQLIGPKGSQLIVNALRSGKNIYGAAAMKSAAKLLRNNVITGVASIVVLSSADIVNIFRSRVSGKQLFKNLAETTASVAGGTAGWMGGAAAGAALGSAVPIIGTAIGGFVGGLLGAFAGGSVSGKVANKALGAFIEDDADEMVRIIENRFKDLAEDYLLSQEEAEKVADELKGVLTGGTLKDMYASTNRKKFATNLLEPIMESVTKSRKKIKMPSAEEMQKSLVAVLEDLADTANEADENSTCDTEILHQTQPTANNTTGTSGKIWNEPLHIVANESKTIKGKVIHIGAVINVYGSLEFQNCEIDFHKAQVLGKIKLFDSAKIMFKDCIVHCPRKKEYSGSSITSEGNAATSIIFEDCQIYGESSFIFTGGTVSFEKCIIKNAPKLFISRSSAVIMNKCRMLYDQAPQFDGAFGSTGSVIHFGDKRATSYIKNSSVEIANALQHNSMRRPYASGTDRAGIFASDITVPVENCRFVNVKKELFAMDAFGKSKFKLVDCYFVNCEKEIAKAVTKTNCNFHG